MGRKEITTKEDLMKVIELFENTGITYWLDGGWGVDILAGKQTRIHRDIDINFDAQHTEKLLNVLLNLGYKIDTDWKPVRIELYSDELGYLDIHPFVLNEDGTSKQADLEGGWYEFEKDYFGSAFFEGKTIPCISLKGQRVFHSGYELRDKDKHDISILESLSKYPFSAALILAGFDMQEYNGATQAPSVLLALAGMAAVLVLTMAILLLSHPSQKAGNSKRKKVKKGRGRRRAR